MKVNYTKLLARKTLIAFLTLVIALSIIAFFVRNSITRELEHIAKLASNIDRDQSKPQQSLLLLQQAENDFQQSLLYPDSAKSNGYKFKITTAFNKIDTLLKSNTDTANLSSEQSKLVKGLYQKKIQLSLKLTTLKHSFDSLLTVYAKFNNEAEKTSPVINTDVKSDKKTVVKTDTVKKLEAAGKKRLFGRLKDAISNTGTAEKNVTVINNNNSVNTSELKTQRADFAAGIKYSRRLQQLQQRNIKLQSLQKQLVTLNLHISNELELIINDLKDINYKMSDELRTMSFKNYRDTAALLNKFYLVALLLVLIFAVLLIVFILELNKSEILLRKENERSVTMAQQKMDLLLHMSHEIRNPLTSIKGFLYIFSKTPLTERQKEMLDSIRSSSDMLLLTLNDTLDTAKMENSEFKINNEPFNPDFILKEVIESMRYSATKKNLDLLFNFEGDQHAILLGDSFRLKQVLINLLSNAIKYTLEGTVAIHAILLSENKGLQVEVIDTGAGISLDQQANLFSKYYQTTSSKGQIGTGLGLYICKQLVELQGGKISVKSNPGTGTTFTFVIPYKKGNHIVIESGTENAVSLLNGIHILAVDDNELNLMFLKVMTRKWNVVFHQATTAEDALELIKENSFSVILTDIQLPGMDGFQLLETIRAMKGPVNQIPIIALSGLSDNTKGTGYKEKGFSGFVPKPFVEHDLVEQLVKALNKDLA